MSSITTRISSGPHLHAPESVPRTMGLVILALMPTTLFGLYLFGWPAAFLFGVTLLSALAAEAVSLLVAGRPVKPFLLDGSALLTGWIVALTLPPWAPWWTGAVGSLIAIVIGKHIYGGLGQNVFNPAMVGRIALLISVPREMTAFVSPQPLFSAAAPDFFTGLGITFIEGTGYDAVSGASILDHVKTQLHQGAPLPSALEGIYDPLALFIGTVPGSLGETSALLILAGGLLLIARGVITWHTPAAMIAAMVLVAGAFHLIDPEHHAGAFYHLLSGTFMLGAFFIATDYVTAPVTPLGRVIFGAGCGVLTYVIRTWSAFPEGVGFAVLMMNAATPIIDHYIRPRIFGRTRRGEPIAFDD